MAKNTFCLTIYPFTEKVYAISKQIDCIFVTFFKKSYLCRTKENHGFPV